MSLNKEQKEQLTRLLNLRDSIVENLSDIEHILKYYFPEEFDVAYQHWIPQISTALYEDKKWLPRGEQTMQHTLNRLFDKIETDDSKGVSKYIV